MNFVTGNSRNALVLFILETDNLSRRFIAHVINASIIDTGPDES